MDFNDLKENGNENNLEVFGVDASGDDHALWLHLVGPRWA